MENLNVVGAVWVGGHDPIHDDKMIGRYQGEAGWFFETADQPRGKRKSVKGHTIQEKIKGKRGG